MNAVTQSKNPILQKTIQINNKDKTQSHKSSPSPEIVVLDDEDMDTEDSNSPLTANNINITIESRIGLDKDSAESLKPGRMVLDDVLEYRVSKHERDRNR